MKMPKTTKGYISMFSKIEVWSHTDLKDFERLPKKLQDLITTFDATISNQMNEIIYQYDILKNKS